MVPIVCMSCEHRLGSAGSMSGTAVDGAADGVGGCNITLLGVTGLRTAVGVDTGDGITFVRCFDGELGCVGGRLPAARSEG